MAQTTRTKIADIAERTLFTAVEALAALWLTSGSISVTGAEVAILTAVAGGLAALRTLISQLLASNAGPEGWVEDLLSRVIFTFAETFVAAAITAAATNLDMSALRSAAIAGFAAAFAALKAALARGLPSGPDSSPAALLPPSRASSNAPPNAAPSSVRDGVADEPGQVLTKSQDRL